MSSAWDLSTASYDSKSLNATSQSTSLRSINVSSDGTKVFLDQSLQSISYQYNLSTAWDFSTASYASVSLNVNSQDASLLGSRFNDDGKKYYFVGNSNRSIFQYSTRTGITTYLAGRALSATSIDLDYST
jgi:hypothetical protein